MRKMLIVGGANGIGLSIASEILKREECEKIYIVDKVLLAKKYQDPKIERPQFDLINSDYSFFNFISAIKYPPILLSYGIKFFAKFF